MLQTVEFAVENGRNVIIEGVFPFDHSHTKYIKLFENIRNFKNVQTYFVWFDIPFAETVRRHQFKPNAHEFGEVEMKRWWNGDDRTHYENEIIITEDVSTEAAVETILGLTKLNAK
jgi:hypothetical protein